jgi:hypothetical protein
MMNVGMRPFYQSFRSNATRLLLAVLVVVLLAVPASASAVPVIQTDRACYLDTPQTTVTVTGNGFAPYTSYAASLDDQPLGSSTTNGQGAMQAAIKPSALAGDEHERTFTVQVAADQPATTTFSVTRFLATFTPATGDATRLQVRFSAFGFGLSGGTPDIYLHYVTPGGRLKKTVRLGRGQGPCGSIEQTAKRRLFPFRHPVNGKWRLQFDTSKTYRRGVKGSPFLFYTVGVSVRAA